MTREEKLISMNGSLLIQVADKLGVKVACNHARTALKEAKANVIKRILEAEAADQASTGATETTGAIKPAEKAVFTTNPITGDTYYHGFQPAEEPAEEPTTAVNVPETDGIAETKPVKDKVLKKANLKLTELTYKGETKSIKEWAAEINMPWPTLYDRVNRNGWPIDLAIETPLGQRRPRG